MHAARALFAALIAATPAAAQDLSAHETALLPRLIDSGCFDIHEANGCETVVLLASEPEPDTADLLILTDRRNRDPGAPLLIVRSVAFNGAMWGMSPSLAETETGFALRSEQIGIGRNAWEQTLTVLWAADEFRITGYSYFSFDRALGGSFSCDLDLAAGFAETAIRAVDPETGEETETIRRFHTDTAPIPLAGWQAFGPTPAPCTDAMTAWIAR